MRQATLYRFYNEGRRDDDCQVASSDMTEWSVRGLSNEGPEHVPEERELDSQTLLPVLLCYCTHP